MKNNNVTENKDITTGKPKSLSPFDIFKMMFFDHDGFVNLPNEILAQNFYIINQIMGIQYPMQAQAFNDSKINGAEAVRYWDVMLHLVGYTRVPGFVYTKGKKKANEAIHVRMEKVSGAQKIYYATQTHVRLCDVDNALEIFGKRMTDDILKVWKRKEFLDNIARNSIIREK